MLPPIVKVFSPMLGGAGIPLHIAAKLLAVYGADALDRLHDDPYRLLAFSSWKTTDAIARRMGVAPTDPRRQVAACEAALHTRLRDGDTLMDGEALRRAAGALPGAAVGDECSTPRRASVPSAGAPQAGSHRAPLYMEDAIAQRIADELAACSRKPTVLPLPDHSIDDVELNPGQASAVAMAMAIAENFSLLVGGAGTGKTTTLKAICRAAAAAGIPVEMMALSGRAALRMREATGQQARTIAGWLKRRRAPMPHRPRR